MIDQGEGHLPQTVRLNRELKQDFNRSIPTLLRFK